MIRNKEWRYDRCKTLEYASLESAKMMFASTWLLWKAIAFNHMQQIEKRWRVSGIITFCFQPRHVVTAAAATQSGCVSPKRKPPTWLHWSLVKKIDKNLWFSTCLRKQSRARTRRARQQSGTSPSAVVTRGTVGWAHAPLSAWPCVGGTPFSETKNIHTG